jgi:thiol-disulfide isomerase/thioredoxin
MPDAIALGPFVLPVLRLGALLVFVFGAWLTVRLAARRGLDTGWAGTTAERSLWVGILAARLGFVATNASAYADAPWTALYLWQPGYSAIAGISAAAVYVSWRTWRLDAPDRDAYVRLLGTGFGITVLLYAGLLGSMRLEFTDASLQVGDTVPEIALVDLSGDAVHLSELRGRGVVLNFWATWCPPCRREMPMLDEVHEAYSPRGAVIVGIAVGEPAATVARYVDEVGVDYPIWTDAGPGTGDFDRTQELLSRFAGIALPTIVSTDGDGLIRAKQAGALSRGILHHRIGDISPAE